MKIQPDIDINLSKILAKALQSMCKENIPFNRNVQFTGNLFMTIDQGDTVDFLVNENILKTDTNDVSYESNSCQIYIKQEQILKRNQYLEDQILQQNDDENEGFDTFEPDEFTTKLNAREQPYTRSTHLQSEIQSLLDKASEIAQNSGISTHKKFVQQQREIWDSISNGQIIEDDPIEITVTPPPRKPKSKKKRKSKKCTVVKKLDPHPDSKFDLVCTTCGKTFNRNHDLIKHERIHSGERPFICKVCGRAFAQICNLNKHERIHSGEKPFSCHLCDKKFPRKDYLETHLQSHSGKKYTCHVCGKGFAHGSHLKEHERIHTGEKPFECKVCGKRFSKSSHASRHRKIHERAKSIEVDRSKLLTKSKGCAESNLSNGGDVNVPGSQNMSFSNVPALEHNSSSNPYGTFTSMKSEQTQEATNTVFPFESLGSLIKARHVDFPPSAPSVGFTNFDTTIRDLSRGQPDSNLSYGVLSGMKKEQTQESSDQGFSFEGLGKLTSPSERSFSYTVPSGSVNVSSGIDETEHRFPTAAGQSNINIYPTVD